MQTQGIPLHRCGRYATDAHESNGSDTKEATGVLVSWTQACELSLGSHGKRKMTTTKVNTIRMHEARGTGFQIVWSITLGRIGVNRLRYGNLVK